MSTTDAILTLMRELGRLKVLPRSGWQFRGIKHPESIADHVYRMSTLSMLLADLLVEQGLPVDADRVTRMALLHELAEARIGDIPVVALRHIPAEAKREAERSAVRDMLADFGPLQTRYIALWEEFETGDTLEAQIVRAADKLELLFQAADYEMTGQRGLDEFWQVITHLPIVDAHPLFRELVTALEARRPTP